MSEDTLNTITIVGRLGDDVDLKDIHGHQLAEFSLATSRISKDQRVTDWHNVKAWRHSAARTRDWRKGDYVWIEGELISDQYEKNGIKITAWSIVMRRGQRISSARPRQVGGEASWH